VSVPARRRQVAYGQERGLSARRACTLFSVARSALDYQSRKATRDAPVIERMKALAAQYPRFGYRRIGIFLGRDGYEMSPGRAYRLWQAAGLQVPRKRPRKRVAVSRPRPQAPAGPNQVWSYDFVFDRCANGQQLKCLTVTDEFTKEGLAIDVDGRRIRSPRVIEVLSRLVSERGALPPRWRALHMPSSEPVPIIGPPSKDRCQAGEPLSAGAVRAQPRPCR
jgi:putative transposase